MIERELHEYSPRLAEKPRVVLLTKADLLAPEEREGAAARAGLPDAIVVSAHSGAGVDGLLENLWNLVRISPEVEEPHS